MLSSSQMSAALEVPVISAPATPSAFSAEETNADGEGRITDAADAKRFILAGKARVTLKSSKTGARFTYRIGASKDGQIHFVSLLNGPDNETAYAYFGYIRRGGVYFHGGQKARVKADASSAKAFAWAWRNILSGSLPENLEVWHEGRCGRCGRALTVPESIRTGFGPECATRVGL
jgi:hypothetical protein